MYISLNCSTPGKVRSTGAHRRDAAWASTATASAAGEGHCTAVSRGWDWALHRGLVNV